MYSFPGELLITVLTGYFGTGVIPATGRLTLRPTALLTDTTDSVTIANNSIPIVLGTTANGWSSETNQLTALDAQDGWFSYPVISTDNQFEQPGWSYEITLDLEGMEEPWVKRYLIPYNDGSIDFSQLSPL